MIKAVQQFQLGSVLTSGKRAEEVLASMKAAGYDGIELCGFMIRKVPFFVKILTKAAGMPVGKGGLDWEKLIGESGLKVVSVHEDLDRILKRTDEVVAEAKAFHTDKIVVTGMYNYDYTSLKSVLSLASELNGAGERLAQRGISLLYHNHNVEFCRVEGTAPYDVLCESTSPEFVNFEFDSYWACEAGCNPLKVMERLGSRMKLWHINDRGSKLKGKSTTPIIKSDSMELGTGNMDLVPMAEKAKALNVEAVVLESHRNWVDNSPVKSFQVSAKFLNEYL